jgi:hypothetical protein
MIMLNQQRAACTYEDLFIDRYDRLLARPMRLTDRDLQQADALVHDVFVKFAITQPDLQRIDNLDGYLYISAQHLPVADPVRWPGLDATAQHARLRLGRIGTAFCRLTTHYSK